MKKYLIAFIAIAIVAFAVTPNNSAENAFLSAIKIRDNSYMNSVSQEKQLAWGKYTCEQLDNKTEIWLVQKDLKFMSKITDPDKNEIVTGIIILEAVTYLCPQHENKIDELVGG